SASVSVCRMRPVAASANSSFSPVEQENRVRPSAEKAQDRTHPAGRERASEAPVGESQTKIVPSIEPLVATRLPSGEKATRLGRLACPAGADLSAPVGTSQRWTVPLYFSTVASVLPSGAKATAAHEAASLVRPRSRPVAASWKRTSSQPAVASVLPSGEKA